MDFSKALTSPSRLMERPSGALLPLQWRPPSDYLIASVRGGAIGVGEWSVDVLLPRRQGVHSAQMYAGGL